MQKLGRLSIEYKTGVTINLILGVSEDIMMHVKWAMDKDVRKALQDCVTKGGYGEVRTEYIMLFEMAPNGKMVLEGHEAIMLKGEPMDLGLPTSSVHRL